MKFIDAFQSKPAYAQAGAVISDREGVGSAQLIKKSEGQSGAIYATELKISPDAIRRELAQTDVGVGEISRESDAALRSHATDQISGKITLTFWTDVSGQVVQRVRVARYTIVTGKGSKATTVTDTLERKRLF